MPHSRLRYTWVQPPRGPATAAPLRQELSPKKGTGAKPVPCPRCIIIARSAYEGNGFLRLARNPVQPRYGREHDRRLLFLNKLACPADGFDPESAKPGFEQLPLFIRDL